MLLTDKSQKQIESFLRYRSAGDSIRNKSKSIVRFFMVLGLSGNLKLKFNETSCFKAIFLITDLSQNW